MKCSKCGRPAVYYRRWEGNYYCADCLMRSVEKQFKQAIRKHSLISKKDRRIAVAVSGGKDSMTLAYLMNRFIKGKEIIPIMINEGISGYRDKTIEKGRKFLESLGLEPAIYSFSDYIGRLDDLVKLGLRQKPCTICATARRHIMNIAAKELGADKLAVGHNLDDEACSVMLNFIKNDSNRFYRLGFMPEPVEGFVTRIKPLRMIPEKEIVIYAELKGFPYYHGSCPYSSDNMRRDILNAINRLERKYPGTKIQIVKFYDSLMEKLARPDPQLNRCRICGEPTSGEICNFCKLKAMIDEIREI